MNKTVTSKRGNIRSWQNNCCKRGITAVNMRTVAAGCGIALGSLYNYFASKAELFVGKR